MESMCDFVARAGLISPGACLLLPLQEENNLSTLQKAPGLYNLRRRTLQSGNMQLLMQSADFGDKWHFSRGLSKSTVQSLCMSCKIQSQLCRSGECPWRLDFLQPLPSTQKSALIWEDKVPLEEHWPLILSTQHSNEDSLGRTHLLLGRRHGG